MRQRLITALLMMIGFLIGVPVIAQEVSPEAEEIIENPNISYSSTPKKYEIGGISVTGVKNYEDYVLIGFSGLTVGQIIEIPGDDVTAAVKRFWKHGLFSDVSISASKIEGRKIFLNIALKQRPRISEILYTGVGKSDREELEKKVGLVKGNQITPNLLDRSEKTIKKYFDEKGYSNATVTMEQRDDLSKENQVFLDVKIDRKEKVTVHKIYITGNSHMTSRKLQGVMKKTNERDYLLNLFKQKKFVPEDYIADKQLILDKYNELGFRDAVIVSDSTVKYSEKQIDVYLNIEEGSKYNIRSIRWVGNTVYPADQLNAVLRMKAGDVYNQKLLNERSNTDEDAVANMYMDRGYLFFRLYPVEVSTQNDSIDLEMRMMEGKQATINKITISGNDRLYENVIRRELRTKPGALFSKSDLMRSAREIAQTGHFNPESMDIRPEPNPENGTVDIHFGLESKANDQIEFSAGWGQAGVIGKLSLKFTNFSMANLFNPKSYKGIIPQGDGQTFTISAQTNAQYYQAYSVSFMDPWFGGKRPNSFSVSAYYSMQSDVNSNFSGINYNPYSNYGNYGGYGNDYSYGYDPTSSYDPGKRLSMLGVTIGFGKRLSWPDDYFTFMTQLSYQRYMMKDWNYFIMRNGNSNNISLNLTLSRNSTDNPVFTRQGSDISLSLAITPPYSSFDGKDYSKITELPEKFKWVEYHKWKFKSKTYTPLTVDQKLILMTRVEYGFVGYYNKDKQSPFEKFYMGGSGMSGYSSMYLSESVALRGYQDGSLSQNGECTAYSRLGVELRYPLMLQPSSTIFVTAFAEAGNAWLDLKDFNPFDLKRSAGVGVRIMLPMIGLLGIDWAYGFDKVHDLRLSGGSQFHFVLGQEF